MRRSGLRYRLGFVALAIGVLLACIAVVAECKNVLRVRLDEDVVSLDPAQLSTSGDRLVLQQVVEGIVQYDWAGAAPYEVKGRLAKSYEILEDGSVIVFHLNEGVQFHRGYGEMTSEDVVFSLMRHMDPAVGSVASTSFTDVTKIEALDRYTVKVTLSTRGAMSVLLDMAWHAAGMILSKRATEELGSQVAVLPIGTGPYQFRDWIPGTGVYLEAFADYWGAPDWGFGKPKFDEIQILLIPDDTIALGALGRGELDCLALLQKGSTDIAYQLKDVTISSVPAGTRQHFIDLNTTIPPLNDRRVREALCYALDLKTIAERLGPMQKMFPSPFNEATFGATSQFWRYTYDPTLAKALLAAAGYAKGMTLKFIYPKVDMFEEVVLETVRYWREIGIDVQLQVVEYALMRPTITKMQHNAVIWSLTRFNPFHYAQKWMTGGSRNYSGYSSPEYDQLVTATTEVGDPERQKLMWEAVQKWVTDEALTIFPALQVIISVVRNDVKGVIVIPFPSLFDFAAAYPAG